VGAFYVTLTSHRGGLPPLHHQHLRNRAHRLPISRVDLLNLPQLGPSIMLELRAAVPDRANVQILLAKVDGDLGAWALEIDMGAVTDPCLLAARGLAVN
jgi:hypothetical protein